MVRQLIIYDQCSPCPYFPDRLARMPLRFPTGQLRGTDLDACLAAGDRRSGMYLYRTACPDCRACEAVRVIVGQFAPRRCQRRVLRKGDAKFTLRMGPPQVDAARVCLFNLHRRERELAGEEADLDADGYSEFLVESCTDTLELSYYDGERLVGVALADQGTISMSAVYCFYDPDYSRWSPGTYSVLKHLELCRQRSLAYLYLGYYIADSPHMSYKTQFRPHQRLLNGKWQRFG